MDCNSRGIKIYSIEIINKELLVVQKLPTFLLFLQFIFVQENLYI